MQMTPKVLLLGALLLLMVIPLTASAQDTQSPYLFLDFGQSDTDLKGFDTGKAMYIGLGYSFNKYLAVEVSMASLTDMKDEISPVWTYEVSGPEFDVVGKIPIGEKVSAYAKVGYLSWDADLKQAGSGTIASDDGSDITYAAGLALSVTESLKIYAQYQTYEVDSINLDRISAGLALSFDIGESSVVPLREEVSAPSPSEMDEKSLPEEKPEYANYINGDVVLVEFNSGRKISLTVTEYDDKVIVGEYEVANGITTSGAFELSSIKKITMIRESPNW